MFGLFYNSYDYHEWHDLVCVSDDARALIEKIKDEKEPLLSGDEQKKLKTKKYLITLYTQ